MTALSRAWPQHLRSRPRRLWAGVVGSIVGALAAGQLIAPAPALADWGTELMLLCFDAGSSGCEQHPSGLPSSVNPHCPAAVRLNGNEISAADLIKTVEFLDRNCTSTRTTVVGHSIGALRAENAARHFGRGYRGNAKFVVNGGTGGAAGLAAMPVSTVMNCNYGDVVCDRRNGSVLSYSVHMPEHYPRSYDNHRPGYNYVQANGAVERPYG